MVKTAIIAVIAAVLAALLIVHYWPGDERAVRKVLAELAETASKSSLERPVQSLLRAKRIADHFADPCHLTIETSGYDDAFSRNQIQDRIVMVRTSFTALTVSLNDISIRFPEKHTANVLLTLRLTGLHGDESYADVQEVEAALHKTDGRWLLTAVRLVAVLER